LRVMTGKNTTQTQCFGYSKQSTHYNTGSKNCNLAVFSIS
jgi:hypothetical protein